MKKSGCRQIGIGVESGSQNILDKVSKRISIPTLRDGLNRISLAHIDIKGYFILDAPGESISDLYKTLKLILTSKFSDIQLNYYAPIPGSIDYHKYNPSDKLWDRMSLQHCLGYAKISPVFYPLIEVSFYIVSYLKIFIGRVLNKIF